MRRTKLAALTCLGLLVLGGAGAAAYLYSVTGLYGFNVLLRRGGSVWGPATADDPRITPGMRLALGASPPVPTAGSVTWAEIAPGFETAEMPVLAGGSTVDKVLLTRFDPARWTFGVHNDPGGNREPADWLKATGAAFVINGSYFERTGLPSIPIVSAGALAGPDTYSASHGAFVSGPGGTTIVDLAGKSWKDVLTGARDASVSYPILIDDKGASRAEGDDRWLANRSFVGEDARGRIVFGTTEDAYLTLNRLGPFLAASPLGLRRALNLDGGPLACQGISVPGHGRDFCGSWEMSVRDDRLSLLRPRFGDRRWGLAMAITASPRASAP